MKQNYMLFILSLALLPSYGYSQTSREHIKSKIQTWKTCSNVAITESGSNIAMYKKNGWAGGDIPQSLADALVSVNKQDQTINDVQVSETGAWFIHYGENEMRWENLSEKLLESLLKFKNDGEIIQNVAFNDSNEWIILSNAHVAASSTDLLKKINSGRQRYGEILWTHLTDKGMALVYKGGYLFYGNVPEPLKAALGKTNLNVKKLKFLTSGSYFIGDHKGGYEISL